MIQPKLEALLNKHHVAYQLQNHLPAYSAQHVAQNAHISGFQLAKAVIVIAEKELSMIVIPAPYELDLVALHLTLGVKHLLLAKEAEFRGYFPQCEVGAIPPFGQLYGMQVILADCLRDHSTIAFSAGRHDEVMVINTADYLKLTQSRFIDRGYSLPSPQALLVH
ncbi:aminoacyl-tRNA deacylase [Motilimonas pumila]|uniref:Deacylase n=1 Tax=Motilimonas pumila TaxID=2303987 RepID=A0A418YD65_9GAMM|nr:YbaK/EbsC family protein [Motilimonas pumila]RJG42419.1 deacylase [Motilimonas pumila]